MYMYKITLFGMTQQHRDLLSTMQARKEILAWCPDTERFLVVWEHDGNEWTPFDAERFMSGLARMLAPAE